MNIPNLPISPIVKTDGYPTDVEANFRQVLIKTLQQNAGPNGLVMPTISASGTMTATETLTAIQNQQNSQGQYVCQLGTMLYVQVDAADYTQDKVVIAFRNDNTYPVTPPIFKVVTVT